MIEGASQIRAYLEGLTSRERRLLLLRAGFQAGAAVLLSLSLAALALSFGGGRWVAVGLLASVALGLGVTGLLWPLRSAWRPAADPLVQARRVEALLPELDHRLVTAVDVEVNPASAGTFSRSILGAIVAEAAGLALIVPPAAVIPDRPARQAGAGLALLLALTLVGGGWLPVGPIDALAVAFGRGLGAVLLENAGPPSDDDARVVVGDIVIRYTYPAYTGLPPMEVPNSDGTIHAPPGTVVDVSGRSAVPFTAAALSVGEEEPIDAVLVDGRDVRARFTVTVDGEWRFLFFSGGAVQRSADFRIFAEADAPPEVSVSAAPSAPVAVDQPVGLRWSAQDDFGLEHIAVQVTRADGSVREVELRRPADQPRDLRGTLAVTPGELGLAPGEEATLKVLAFDAQPGGGTQMGESPEVKIKVGAAKGRGKNLVGYYERLRDAMIPALGDFLEEPLLPARDAEGMNRWVQGARGRLDAVVELRRAQWGGQPSAGLDGELVDKVVEAAARLFRFTLTTWESGSGRRVTAADEERFRALHSEEIKALEQAIYLLDTLVGRVAMQELADRVSDLADEARELAGLADDAGAAELLARLDQLERLMKAIAKAAERLDNHMGEYVNAQISQTQALTSEIRKAISEGRMEDARAMLQQLAEQVDQMAENIQSQASGGADQGDELKKAYDEAMKELEALEADQRALAEKLEADRERYGESMSEQMKLWADLDRLSAQADAQAKLGVGAVGDGAGWRASSITWLERLSGAATGVADAVRARDVEGAADRVARARSPMRMARASVEDEQRRARLAGEKVPEGVPAAARGVQGANGALEEMARLLDQLSEMKSDESPEMQRAARELANQQSDLEQRRQSAGKKVERVERAMPTADGSASGAIQQAGEAMGRAEEALREGQASAGEGHQLDAANRVGEARDNLQQQMQQMQQMQQAARNMRKKSGEGEGEQHGPEDQGMSAADDLALPPPEDFPSPEAYRQGLLRGMEASVPEEYEALKKRYFEDLVRQ